MAQSLRPESGKLQCGETWAPNAADLQRLRHNDRSMIRWICGVDTRDEVPSTTLRLKLGIKETSAALRIHLIFFSDVLTLISTLLNRYLIF